MEAWMKDPDPRGVQALIEAMVKKAIEDWKDAAVILSNEPECQSAQNRLADCERFFLSDYFLGLTNIDGERVLNKLKGDFKNGEHYHGQTL